jgi:hypothetical protein
MSPKTHAYNTPVGTMAVTSVFAGMVLFPALLAFPRSHRFPGKELQIEPWATLKIGST